MRTLLVLFQALLSGGDMNVDATNRTYREYTYTLYIVQDQITMGQAERFILHLHVHVHVHMFK